MRCDRAVQTQKGGRGGATAVSCIHTCLVLITRAACPSHLPTPTGGMLHLRARAIVVLISSAGTCQGSRSLVLYPLHYTGLASGLQVSVASCLGRVAEATRDLSVGLGIAAYGVAMHAFIQLEVVCIEPWVCCLQCVRFYFLEIKGCIQLCCVLDSPWNKRLTVR